KLAGIRQRRFGTFRPEDDLGAANGDDITWRQDEFADSLAVEERAVGRAEVFEHQAIAFRQDLAVHTRRLLVGKDDVITRFATDPNDRIAYGQNFASAIPIEDLEDVVGHVIYGEGSWQRTRRCLVR